MKILVLTLSFGSGHVKAAHAVARELRCEAAEAEVHVVDALSSCRWLFRAAYVWPYWLMIRYAPWLWGRLFAARVRKMNRQTAPRWAFRLGCPEVFKTIAEFGPDTIIAVEVAASEMAVIARKTGLTRAQIINVITDYETEPVWVKAEVDAYLVADRVVASQLHSWGAPEDRIEISGIPIDAAFHKATNARETRFRYGFSDGLPLILLMGGGMGPTHMDQIAALLCQLTTPMHIIALAGHDARMRRRLSNVRATRTVTLKVLGWCDDVAALMQAATLLVTKPGGLTTAEAAACQLPVVIFDPIPGPELGNTQRLVDAGAGIFTRGAEQTVAAIVYLLRDERARCAMSLRARELARPAAASRIANRALECSNHRGATVPERMVAV